MHKTLAPRKTPVQTRSNATVHAIFEASIQVLLKHGYAKLTTTLVSERAGVSVGTLYQYFPHKDALLAAVIGYYVEAIGVHVRRACDSCHAQPLLEMVDRLVCAAVEAKTRRIDVSLALHGPMATLDGSRQVALELARTRSCIQAMLATCTDRIFEDLPTTTDVLLSAMSGTIQAQLEYSTPTTPDEIARLKGHLRSLATGYLSTVSTTAPAVKKPAAAGFGVGL